MNIRKGSKESQGEQGEIREVKFCIFTFWQGEEQYLGIEKFSAFNFIIVNILLASWQFCAARVGTIVGAGKTHLICHAPDKVQPLDQL